MQRRREVNVFMAGALALCLAGEAACGSDGGGSGAGPGVDHGDADATGPDASSDASTEPGALAFPDDFLFGVATAGFQVDMGCPTLPVEQCVDDRSDWYAYVTSEAMQQEGTTHLSGDPISGSPGHWELYEQDYDLVANDLGLGGFRFSFEWSRIFPEPTDDVEGYEALGEVADADAVAHYHAMLDALAARGITPLATLNHYTLPAWIHDGVGCHEDMDACGPRGWVDRERTVREIAKYAGFVAEEFGGKVDLWATENEPFAVVLPGYIYPSPDRTNPPALMLAVEEAKTVLRGLVEAHARMYDAVTAADTVDADGDGDAAAVGLVYAMTPMRAKDPEEPLDVQGAENAFYIWNLAFLDAVVKGRLDGDLDGEAEHRDDLAGRMDWLGINYYTRATLEGTEDPFLADLSPLTTFNPLTLQAWEDYPRGIYEMIMLAWERYGLPMYVTENGLDVAPVDTDTARRFLVHHLTWVWRAVRDGADLRGYFFWSLMDNYEWNHGFGMRFGLYEVDPEDPDKARVPRGHVETYRDIAGSKAISLELQEAFPVPEEAE